MPLLPCTPALWKCGHSDLCGCRRCWAHLYIPWSYVGLRLAVSHFGRWPKACLSCFSCASTVVFFSFALALISFLPNDSRSLSAFFLSPLYAFMAALLLTLISCGVSLNAFITPVSCMSHRIFFVLALIPSFFRCKRSHRSISPRAFFMLSEKGTAPILSFRHFFSACLRAQKSRWAIFSYSAV